MLTDRKIKQAYKILDNYKGKNPYVSYLSRIYMTRYRELNDFELTYAIDNKNYAPKAVNKIVKITEEYGKKFADKFGLEFIPEKLYVTSIIGELEYSYHCYVIYRKSVTEPTLIFLPKRAILTDMFSVDYTKMKIDFSKFNALSEKWGRTLKPHQEEDVKFLVTNKKCILASQQGTGKTTSAIVASLAGKFKKILIICPASLKGTWKRELQYYVPEDEIEVVFSKNMEGNKKYTIINYDIVQNFHTVPKEIDYEEVMDENGNVIRQEKTKKSGGKEVTKMKKSRNKELMIKCLESSKLFKCKFDLVIIDEAHKLSNNTSIRYETIYDFLKKSKPEGIFLITGTPLTNNPKNLYHILKLIDAPIVNDYDLYMKRYCGMKKIRLKTGRTVKLCKSAMNLDELREKIKTYYVRRLQKDIPGMVQKNIVHRFYDLPEEYRNEYDTLWYNYNQKMLEQGKDFKEYQKLIEGGLIRRFLAEKMVKNTISLAEEHIEDGEKVFIVCSFQNEVNAFKEHFGKTAVVYDGKKTAKQKDSAEYAFMHDPKIKVFIGQIVASGVGLTLTESHICIFNSFSWLSIENDQAMDRIFRLTQKEDVTIYFQLFDEPKLIDMWNKVMEKDRIFNELIKGENEKT